MKKIICTMLLMVNSIYAMQLKNIHVITPESDLFGRAPQRYSHFGHALGKGDFNNDGYDDLVVASPRYNIGNENAGLLTVIYGGGYFPSPKESAASTFYQGGLFSDETAGKNDQFGFSVATGDFNNDGFDDLAIGTPFEKQEFGIQYGDVKVAYGSTTGLQNSDQNEILSLLLTSVPGVVQNGDQFGFSLTSGDFNNDGYDDLAVGNPSEDQWMAANGQWIVNSGGVRVFKGTQAGLVGWGPHSLIQNQSTFQKGDNKNYDSMGWSLASGDFNNDGYDDLAIGVPFEDIGHVVNAGAVRILFGSREGPTLSNQKELYQDILFSPGASQEGELFGYALTSGDFNGDGFDDLAIGAPHENLNAKIGGAPIDSTGSTTILYGSKGNRVLAESEFIQLPASGAYKGNERDLFGASLMVGDLDSDGIDDLIVGAPLRDYHWRGDFIYDAGAVFVYKGEHSGVNEQSVHMLLDFKSIEADISGGNLAPQFGFSMIVGNFDGVGSVDLVVGSPRANLESEIDISTGRVVVFSY